MNETTDTVKTRGWQIENGGWMARSVLECGRPLPLSEVTPDCRWDKSAGGPAQSKTWRRKLGLLALCFSILHSSFCLRAWGQTYSIDWYKVSGGGGTSTGGVYSVSGTIGQHDAGGPMTGGQYSLTGGFWALYALQTPGAPLLKIFLTTTNTAVVQWPFPSTGYSLQQNTNLTTATWVAPAESVNNDGTNKFIIVNPPAGNRFYRLKNP